MEDMRGILDGVNRMYHELDEKISEKGGIGGVIGMHRKIRETMECVSVGELESFLGEILRAKEALNRLEDEIVEMRILKEAYASAAARITSASHRLG
jgi:hypothetical protein